MENNNYSVLYEKKEGIFFHFKQYVLRTVFPFFLMIFIVLNSILLIANQQWTYSKYIFSKKNDDFDFF